MGPEDWQGELLKIAVGFVAEPVVYVDAYHVVYAEHVGRVVGGVGPGAVVALAVNAAIWVAEAAVGHHDRAMHGRPGSELLILTSSAVLEAEVKWRAGQGWTSDGLVRTWDRSVVQCRQVDEDYTIELTEVGSDDRVVLRPFSLNGVDVRICRELGSSSPQ